MRALPFVTLPSNGLAIVLQEQQLVDHYIVIRVTVKYLRTNQQINK
jgi:hypothetical protein